MTKRSFTAGALLAGLAATCTLIVPTAAMAAPPEAPSDLGPRIERACQRVANIETRTDNLIRRLEGDATTRGSLAWLEAAIARAEENDRADLAEVLRNRLDVRTLTLEVLQLRRDELIPSLKAFCTENGIEV